MKKDVLNTVWFVQFQKVEGGVVACGGKVRRSPRFCVRSQDARKAGGCRRWRGMSDVRGTRAISVWDDVTQQQGFEVCEAMSQSWRERHDDNGRGEVYPVRNATVPEGY